MIPGSEGIVEDVNMAMKEAQKIGFPVFIKAVPVVVEKGFVLLMMRMNLYANFLLHEQKLKLVLTIRMSTLKK